MAFTVKDMPDLTRILLDHPEWLAEVRRLVLTDELLNLPSLVRELAAIQQRGEQRMERAITELIATQQQTAQQIAELTSAQQQTAQRVSELTAAQQRTEQRMEEFAAALQRTDQNVNRLDRTLQTVRGTALEQKYTLHAAGYFGKWLRRIKVIHPHGVMPEFEELLDKRLSDEEVDDILLLDVILRGNLKRPETRPEIYLAMEVSVTIEAHDIHRAQTRSALLRKAGLPAIPVVAGERLDEQADDLARTTPIVVVQNGRSWGWDETVAAYSVSGEQNK
ncbi:MAG: hypothetical protein ACOYNY_13720 [Caldilineaceae bacterium]